MYRISLLALLGASACVPAEDDPVDNAWVQVWSDEFSGAEGVSPDAEKWQFDTGGDGWGNDQLEYNTNSTDNAYQSGNGKLRIVALEQTKGDNAYTSARIKTKDLFEIGFGRIEARIKVPAGQGLWPAFWMLGADIDEVSWPTCGEIDVMEVIGDEPGVVHGSIHGPGYSGGSAVTDSVELEESDASDDFHTYRVDFNPDRITWYVDDVQYATASPGDVAGLPWVFDGDFFLILNLAVGGTWPGDPDDQTEFPATMYVDWVRVYERAVLYDTDAG